MTALAATVLIPTHAHSELLPYAARSALRQTVSDLELLIVGDGVADATREAVASLMQEDERVRFFDRPKGERNGESHRDPVLRQARGEVVCYLSDDDLWLPDHVETMVALLAEADFASAIALRYLPGDELEVLVHDLDMHFYRELLLSGKNRVPLSAGAHTMAMYHRLPFGWRTTPPGTPTDVYMWQQFLTEGSCRLVTAMTPTVLNFPSSTRRAWSPARRAAELKAWSDRLSDPEGREGFATDRPAMIVEAQTREWARLFSEWQSLMAAHTRRQAENERLRTELERVKEKAALNEADAANHIMARERERSARLKAALEAERERRRELAAKVRMLRLKRRQRAFAGARRLVRRVRSVRA